ncbi:MAG: lipid A biosynthesis acyltransferase [Abyssibacter sp.]|uniref:LpxL/LpxP family acyltransferase n=1 Tax=Abyssibacter sp. TaxID=2320200 RepID=UPI00321BAAAD
MKRLAERPAPTHLRHWGDWLIYGLLRLFLLLPYPVLMWFGTGMGRVFRWLSASRRHVVETNLRMCFPEQGARARAEMAKAHFEAMGRGLIEASLAWWGTDRKLAARGEVVGLEHLDRALEQGGVILLTGHFTTLELAARYVAMQRPFHAMYRPLDNLFWDVVTTRAREAQSCRPSVPRRDLRALIKTLRQGGAVWYGPDQTLSHRNSAFVPFFGVQTLTLTATSRLAAMGRAQVVPFYPVRLPGDRYRVIFEPPLADFPGEDPLADTRRITASLEAAIRRCPEQYFWMHRRFKKRPEGAAPIY